VRAFLERFKRTRLRFNIPIDAVYNIDKTSVALGVYTNSRVLASLLKKKTYVKSPKNYK
jgi:hypothetical protein